MIYLPLAINSKQPKFCLDKNYHITGIISGPATLFFFIQSHPILTYDLSHKLGASNPKNKPILTKSRIFWGLKSKFCWYVFLFCDLTFDHFIPFLTKTQVGWVTILRSIAGGRVLQDSGTSQAK